MPFFCEPSNSKQYRCFNFSAGPSCLPIEVLRVAQDDMLNYNHSGMSVMEMSHRGKEFKGIYSKAVHDLRNLIKIPDNYKLLFAHGGATNQFSAVPMHLIEKDTNLCEYLVTGYWGQKAMDESWKWAKPKRLFDLAKTGYNTIPPVNTNSWASLDKNSKYLHYTSNETISGVQFDCVPNGLSHVPLVCDMSSDFCSKPIDVAKYGVIYAGAQKNIGIAGVCVLIVREDLLGKEMKQTPSAMNWAYADKYESMYNTPPTWSIYMMGLYAKHLLESGGLVEWEEKNNHKANLLYDYIDSSDGFYQCHVPMKSSRSRTNAAFRVTDGDGNPCPEREAKFIEFAKSKGLIQLNGHRSIGGCRASLYNGMPLTAVETLVECMKMFKEEC
eukprot:Selendium_serpulae@DN2045_c0_g1_i1.p1